MRIYRKLATKKNKILIFSYHFPPDQSAGARRMEIIVKKLSSKYPQKDIFIFTSIPIRYNIGKKRLY